MSGVPGTGKTATTQKVIDYLTMQVLNKTSVDFDFVEINGMRLNDPAQAYSILAHQILGITGAISGNVALKKLEAHFKSKNAKKPCVVLLDELDLLLKKKQSILYHFFEWPNWQSSKLTVITVANTMYLP